MASVVGQLPSMIPMPEGYYKGRVKLLILFFEELAESGKILQFSHFYERYVKSNGVTLPMKELQCFINDLPTKKTEEEKQEIVDQLFNRNDPNVKQILDSFLETNKNPISETKLDSNGNVVRVYFRKDSTVFSNGGLHINGDDVDSGRDDDSSKNEQEESSSDLDWLKQNDKFIKLFEKEDDLLTKQPAQNHEDHMERRDNGYETQESEFLPNEKSELVEKQPETEPVEKELSEKDKEAAEISAAQKSLHMALNSSDSIVENWDFNAKKENEQIENGTEKNNNEYQSLFKSLDDLISGIDQKQQKELEEELEMEKEKQRKQEELENEHLRQIEEQRRLYEQQQREIEQRLKDIEEQKRKDEDNGREHEKMKQDLVNEQNQSGTNQESIEVVVKVEESNQTASEPENSVASHEQNKQTDSNSGQSEVRRTIPKTLELEHTDRSSEQDDPSTRLNTAINSLVLLYIKFIAALDRILTGDTEKIDKYEQFMQIHDLYQGLVDRLICIDESRQPNSEEYNKDILNEIREFYTSEQFLTILKLLKSDDSEFCKVVDYLLTKTNAKSQEISDEFSDVDAQNLAAITKERLESVQQIGRENQAKVKELLRNNSQNLQPNYEKLITCLTVIIKHFSKYDYLAASSMHLEKYEKLQVKQPGKLCLFRDKMILIIEKKPKSETVFSSLLKDVKVQQVVKNPSAPKKFFGQMFSCRDESLVTDDDVEKNASNKLLQITQRTEKYRNTFRLQIISGEKGRAPDAKEFANIFDKLAKLPDFQSVLGELEEFEKE